MGRKRIEVVLDPIPKDCLEMLVRAQLDKLATIQEQVIVVAVKCRGRVQ